MKCSVTNWGWNVIPFKTSELNTKMEYFYGLSKSSKTFFVKFSKTNTTKKRMKCSLIDTFLGEKTNRQKYESSKFYTFDDLYQNFGSNHQNFLALILKLIFF